LNLDGCTQHDHDSMPFERKTATQLTATRADVLISSLCTTYPDYGKGAQSQNTVYLNQAKFE